MKMAEALAERADLDKKISALLARIRNTARYIEGEEPESAVEMLQEARSLLGRKQELISRINRTNAETLLESGITVTSAIATRDRLNQERNLLTTAADAASPEQNIYSRGRRRTELPEKTDLNVREIRAEADRLAREFREIDTEIQQLNWTTELL